MSALYEELCDALAGELERQETVLAVCRSQQEALLARDVARVRDTARSLEVLTREAREAEHNRNAVTARLAQVLALASTKPTLSELIALSPEPWRSRLGFYQKRLRAVLAETRALVRENELRARRSAQIVQRCLSLLAPQPSYDSVPYDMRGALVAVSTYEPALLDARG